MAEKSQPSSSKRLDQPSSEASISSADADSSDGAATSRDPPPYTPAAQAPQVNTQPQSSNSQHGTLIAIPAVGAPSNSPFLRAYAPILKDYQLPQESFLSFLDQLNTAVSTSPPLQVLDVVGGILNAVPILFPINWIGSTISEIANAGSLGVSKSRADSNVRRANKDIFAPRGLRVEIVKLDALAHIAKIPILNSQGKINWRAELFQDSRFQGIDGKQQLVQILQPWIAELELNVLPWTNKSKLTRLNASLKKRNNSNDRSSESSESKTEGDGEFERWKGLWLVIRDLKEDTK